MKPRIYFDTNPFIWTIEEISDRSELLNAILATSGAGKSPAVVTSEITLAELLVLPLRNRQEDLARRYDDLIYPSPWLNVRPVDRAVLWRASALRAGGRIKLPDAIHLATAELTGCTYFLSADTDFAADLPRNKPDLSGANPSLVLATPDLPTLTTLLDRFAP